MTRTAERLLTLDPGSVNLPRYATELRDAARFKRAIGDPNLIEDAVARWHGQVSRLGQGPTGEHGAYTMKSATKQLIADMRKAKPEQVDKVVDRWILEKARYQARIVARNESVEAYRDVTIQSANEQPWVVGIRWTLSGSHPKPDVCFPAGTMVETATGPIPIESVAVGDEVLTHLGRWRRVTRLYRTTQAEGLLRLRFRVGTSQVREVVTTPNHPFATAYGWTRADALRIGDAGYALADVFPQNIPDMTSLAWISECTA